jgi:hypothetical protein
MIAAAIPTWQMMAPTRRIPSPIFLIMLFPASIEDNIKRLMRFQMRPHDYSMVVPLQLPSCSLRGQLFPLAD